MIKVCEFALLLKEGGRTDIDCHSIPTSAFDWLLINGQSKDNQSVSLVRVKKYNNNIALQVVNYVGVLETPCGTRIEIVPKISITQSNSTPEEILLKMLSTVHKLSFYKFEQSNIQTRRQTLLEILISYFLQEITALVKKGIRSHYQRTEVQQPYLKGQLQLVKQMRQRPGCRHQFHIVYDHYSSDRPENRLIRSSLQQVIKWSKYHENQRLAKELIFLLQDVPCSKDYQQDFNKWSCDRSLGHYKKAHAWCQLIINTQCPLFLSGQRYGISFLFPMEQLFERYVAIKLQEKLSKSFEIRTQVSKCALVMHKNEAWFQLKPDMTIVEKETICSILDTKWKFINQNKGKKYKYGISQADMYQMFAYGQKYLAGKGSIYLIYPAHTEFNKPLEPFKFDSSLSVTAIPYDLETDECVFDILNP